MFIAFGGIYILRMCGTMLCRARKVYVDFDARTGHNHGTKFRIRYTDIPSLYKNAEVVLDERNR